MMISSEIKDSATLRFGELARKKNAAGEKVISLGIGEPDFPTPYGIVEATHDAIDKGYTKYSSSNGLAELRALISEKLRSENGVECPAGDIVVTNGAKQAMMLALMAILRPHDRVINIAPSYVSYIPQIKIAEPTAVIRNVDMMKNDFSIDWDAVSGFAKSGIKAVIVNSPNNPTGRMFSRRDIESLADIAASSGCYVLSDEVYEKMGFSGREHLSPGAVIKKRVVTINGFSKTYGMTGWRLGYLAADRDVADTASKLQQHINTNVCTFVQKGACAAFSPGSGKAVAEYNSRLKTNSDNLKRIIGKSGYLSLVPPEGGMFAFVNIKKTGLGSDDFALGLLDKKNVAVIPGISFGDNWDNHVRVSLCAGADDFALGVELMAEFASAEG